MPTPPAPDPGARPSAARDMRRHLLHLVLGVAVLDAIAIGVYRAAGVEGWSTTRRQLFTVVWMVLTLVIVGISLTRVRTARLRARRARAGMR